MSMFGYSIIGFLVAIAILVAVHEFGHFWVARKLGVKVLKFSIGFGKPLFSWRRANDPTEYTVAMIPLGGYVKMLDEREGDVDPQEAGLAFNNQSLAVRSAVVVAGPAFNFLFAIVAIWLIFMVGVADTRPVVGQVVTDSIAAQAGLEVGDQLIDIDGRIVRTWGQHQLYLYHQALKGKSVTIRVQNNTGIERDVEIDFSKIDQRKISNQVLRSGIGIWPPLPPAGVSEVVTGSPAEQAGLRAGDKILSIDGQPLGNWVDMVKIISASPGKVLRLKIERDQELVETEVTPDTVSTEQGDIGQIGVYPPSLTDQTLKYGPVSGLLASLSYNWHLSGITLRSLWRMLTANMSTENLSGPITIARFAGHTVQSSWIDFIKFLAIISVSLGLLNLLPIPVLDGGHLLYFLIELVKGSPPSEQLMLRGQQIGILMLGLLMSLAFYNDIMRLF